jgi:hypothetical protein
MNKKVCVDCNQQLPIGNFRTLIHKTGRIQTRSNCVSCENLKKRNHYKNKPFNTLAREASKRAKKKNLACSIDESFLEQLWQQQKGQCYWSKQPMCLELTKGLPNQVSVDRLDNSKGYTKDNVVLVSLAMNYCRNQLPVETWLEYLQSLGILGLLSFSKAS